MAALIIRICPRENLANKHVRLLLLWTVLELSGVFGLVLQMGNLDCGQGQRLTDSWPEDVFGEIFRLLSVKSWSFFCGLLR